VVEMDDAPRSADPWTSLWQQTSRSAWDLRSEDAIAMVLREHWKAQAPWILDSDHVVDVGSGPAVLTRLLQSESARGDVAKHPAQWTCIDQAQIPASSVADLTSVTGTFGSRWEDLTSPESPAVALVSNFGLEYVSRQHLVRACASWLAPGGRLHAVLHARDSVIDAQSALGLADLHFVLDELDFPHRVAELLKAKVSAPSDPVDRMMHGMEVRDAFNQGVNGMKSKLEERGARQGALLEWLVLSRDLVQKVSEPTLQSMLERLQGLTAAYRAESGRLSAMRSSAMDRATLSALEAELLGQGFESIRWGVLEAHQEQVAWTLDAMRAKGTH